MEITVEDVRQLTFELWLERRETARLTLLVDTLRRGVADGGVADGPHPHHHPHD